MKIAILGAGNVGATIARHAIENGHTVSFGVRDQVSEKTRQTLSELSEVPALTASQAVKEADIVFLALPWGAVKSTLKPLADFLVGKVLVDCTNAYSVTDGQVQPAVVPTAAHWVQTWAPQAHVVKAFNQIGAARLSNPHFRLGKPWMGVASDHADALEMVSDLARKFGFAPVTVGGLSAALALEDMARVWIHCAYVAQLGPSIGFALLRD